MKLARDDRSLAPADLTPGLLRDLPDDVADELPQPEGDDANRDVLDPRPVEKREHNFSFRSIGFIIMSVFSARFTRNLV